MRADEGDFGVAADPSSAESVAARWRSRLASIDWRRTGIEVVILVVLIALAAVPRLVLLGEIPPGLHGDEAGFGLEGRRILKEGNIGVFTHAATGTPAGTFYWIAAVFKVFGQSVFTLRLAYALLGIATVPLAYLAFWVMFNRATGVIAAALLSVMAWHLHFSRIAHVSIAWPLVETAFLLALFLGLKHSRAWFFMLAGIFLGFGIYTYAAYTTFAGAAGVFLVYLGVFHFRRRLSDFVTWTTVLAAAAIFAAWPMITYYHDNPGMFSNRIKQYSITRTPEYREADNVFERGRVVADEELDFIRLLTSEPVPDGVDAAGVFPLVNKVMLWLVAAGGAICVWRWRNPAHAFLIVGIVGIAMGPAIATDFPYRRSLGMVPLLCGAAALPLGLLWEKARSRGRVAALAAGVIIAAAVAAVGFIDMRRYFTTYDNHPDVRWVFSPDMSAASRFMADQPDSTYIYFVFDRAHFNHEIRLFIAPDAQGENRSAEWNQKLDLIPDRSRDVAYVFMGRYMGTAALVAQMYPGGREYRERDNDGNLLFEAYVLPRTAQGLPDAPR